MMPSTIFIFISLPSGFRAEPANWQADAKPEQGLIRESRQSRAQDSPWPALLHDHGNPQISGILGRKINLDSAGKTAGPIHRSDMGEIPQYRYMFQCSSRVLSAADMRFVAVVRDGQENTRRFRSAGDRQWVDFNLKRCLFFRRPR
jgi:hypothetical protein